MFDFNRKKVLITGASSGLGAALALALSKKGAYLVLIARRQAKLKSLASHINQAGGQAKIFPCDVADYQQVKTTYRQLKNKVGAIDVAFLNAGIGSQTLAQNLSVKEVKSVMNTNYFGVVNWLEPLLKQMQPQNKGIIVITSSLAAYRGLPGSGSYAASKAALTTLIESCQIDLLATKIKLILIMPYFMITEMSGLDQPRNLKIWTSAQKAARVIINGIAQGKQEIIFPWHFHLFMYIMKIIPLPIYRLFWKIIRRGG